MYHPTNVAKLSPAQISKILNGHRVRVKAGNAHVLHLSQEQHKKVMSAHKKGCGTTIQLDPFQQQMEHHHKLKHGHGGDGVSRGRPARRGRGAFDFLKSAIKAVAPLAIDEGGKFIKSKVDGWGVQHKKTKKRAVRKTKGDGFFDDLASGLIHVGLPTAGHLAGEVLGGPAGAMVGEQLGNFAGDTIGNLTGRGLPRVPRRKRGGALFPAGGALLPAGY